MKFYKTYLIAALTLAGCSNSAPTSQDVVDTIASDLIVNYAVTHNKWGTPCSLPDRSKQIEKDPCYEGNITLTSNQPILSSTARTSEWEIYYSQVEPIFAAQSNEFTIDHINGDLHRIRPTKAFTGFEKGVSKKIDFIVLGQVLTEAKLMPNYYVVAKNAKPQIIQSTKLSTAPDTGLIARPYITPLDDTDRLFRKSENDNTQLATANHLYTANAGTQLASLEDIDHGIIPTPTSVIRDPSGGRLGISDGIAISQENLESTSIKTAIERLKLLGIIEAPDGAPVNISIQSIPNSVEGAYTLNISESGISIVAGDEAGAAYALASIASLYQLGNNDLPFLTIKDQPRFAFRGMHVDVARNFHSKTEVIKLLDQMAAYKLNKLHLHLADDEGWRLEIPGLPELTEIGSKRCHDLEENTCLLMQLGSGPTGTSDVDGYYSVADYTDILQAATARHIQVIPSLDMPGHARAAVKSMEARYRRLMAEDKPDEAKQYLLSDPDDASVYQSIQYYSDNTINPCMESSFIFLEKMIDEVQQIHRAAGHPLNVYHIGADETAGAWTKSPVCEAFFENNSQGISKPKELGTYFIERMANILSSKDIKAGAWNDGLDHADPKKLPANLQSNIWGVLPWGGVTPAHKHANYGWDAVLSYPDVLYFDFPYEADPKEGGYYWAARHTNTRKVFNFMPGNSPIHAEFWQDSSDNNYEINDRVQRDETGKITHTPLSPEHKFSGIQGHIWSETVPTDDELEYRVFPRLLALAERAWHKPDWEVPYNYDGAVYNSKSNFFSAHAKKDRDKGWNNFASIISQKEFPKLDIADIFYRIPTLGGVVQNGQLHLNSIFPGLPIEYREHDGNWLLYEKPVAVSGEVYFRARSANQNRAGRSLTVNITD